MTSGNACYHSVQSILSSRLLLKNLKIIIYNTRIKANILHGLYVTSRPVGCNWGRGNSIFSYSENCLMSAIIV
jgi:hypothetical protein